MFLIVPFVSRCLCYITSYNRDLKYNNSDLHTELSQSNSSSCSHLYTEKANVPNIFHNIQLVFSSLSTWVNPALVALGGPDGG